MRKENILINSGLGKCVLQAAKLTHSQQKTGIIKQS